MRVIERWSPLIMGILVGLSVLIVALPVMGWGFSQQRYVNTVLSGVAFMFWMRGITVTHDEMVRRSRRISLATAGVIGAAFYGSLDGALDPFGNPIDRVLVTSVALGWFVAAITYAPDDDYEIPAHHVYPWEPWIKATFRRVFLR